MKIYRNFLIVMTALVGLGGLATQAVASSWPSGTYTKSCYPASQASNPAHPKWSSDSYKKSHGIVYCNKQGNTGLIRFENNVNDWDYPGSKYFGIPLVNCGGLLHPMSCNIDLYKYPPGTWHNTCMPVAYDDDAQRNFTAICASGGPGFYFTIETTVKHVSQERSACANIQGKLTCVNEPIHEIFK